MQAIDKAVKHLAVYWFRISCFCFLLVACPALGQALQKKALKEADYKLWGTLDHQKISDHGGWVSYSMRYENADTLFVKNTVHGKTFAYPRSYDGVFGGEAWFGCLRSDTLSLQNLKTGQLRFMTGISRFAFSGNGKYLLLFYREAAGTESLVVQDDLGQIVAGVSGMQTWQWNADQSALAYSSSEANTQTLAVLSLHGKVAIRKVTNAVSGAFKNLVWQKEFLAFMHEDLGSSALHLYHSKSLAMQTFKPELCAAFPKAMSLSVDGLITISADGSRVAFGLKEPKVAAVSEEVVQVWQVHDRQLYPSLKKYGDFTLYDKVGVWFPKSNRFMQLTDRKEYVVALGPKGLYALTYDPMAYEPHSDAYPPLDVYATQLATGKKELILQKISGHYGTLQLSPEGKYLTYVREKHWWVYDFAKGTHTNVTATLGVPVYQVDFDRAGEVPMCGIAGWLLEDKALLVYDQYDVWEIAVDGSQKKRLTFGREIETRFRIDNISGISNALVDGLTTISAVIDKANGLLLHAQNSETGFSGYYSFAPKTGMRQLVWRCEKTDRLIKANSANRFSYVAERFDCPPTLLHFGNNKATTVYQSNSHHYYYQWGHAERITYTAHGKDLSGILFFPADYDRSRMYPMIVSIYERQDGVRHQYVNPTLFNEGGINVANLSSQGYFVLFPDIAYTMGAVGNSVIACVLAATDAVLAKYPVDTKRLGLTGHSFGGYETFLAITKTNRFAAAFAGSASSDLVSTYLQVGGNTKPNIFRFEHQQYRMGCSLFEDRDRYLRNSPVLLAEGVQTPLLAWAGEQDDNVNPLQSKEFYLAMRRLGKEHTLLVYPRAGHSLSDQEQQADLTHRFEAWFAKYLKP